MKKILIVITILLLLGCTKEVKEENKNEDIKMSAQNITNENMTIIIENNTDKKLAIEDATIVGFTQTIDNVNEEYIITFPEKLYVGQNIDPDNVIKMLTSNGNIRGDVGYMINDDKSEYRIIGGKRIINLLSSDLKAESEKVIYPIEITIKNNVITNIQMIFVDQ